LHALRKCLMYQSAWKEQLYDGKNTTINRQMEAGGKYFQDILQVVNIHKFKVLLLINMWKTRKAHTIWRYILQKKKHKWQLMYVVIPANAHCVLVIMLGMFFLGLTH
jgi:hypothetical protein